MISLLNKQNIYIRKANGLGQKISVSESLRINQLKQIVRSLKSLEASGLKEKDFNLIFKGRNITQKSQSTLKQLGIPSDGIIHLVFASDQEKKNSIFSQINVPGQNLAESDEQININISKPVQQLSLRVIYNGIEHQFLIHPSNTVLELKKKMAVRLNLIYQSLVLSHLGTQMLNQKQLRQYSLQNDTLISLKFNLHKNDKKKLQSRMVSSVTFSDQNNEPNSQSKEFTNKKNDKIITSSKSIDSEKQEIQTRTPKKLTSLLGPSQNKTNMYKSQITSFASSQTSKAALMFKNALHQKIIETQSVVSGSFSEDTSFSGCDPNSLMITVKNQQDTKEFLFECAKTHQIVNIKYKLLKLQNVQDTSKLQISLEEDLFESIDLGKSGCITLNQIVKKMGKQRAVFTYRII